MGCLTVMQMIYPDAIENEIIENIRNIVKLYPEQKQIPDNIDDICDLSEYIMNIYNIDDLDDLQKDIEDLTNTSTAPMNE